MNAVVDRVVQYPNRFRLTNISDGTVLGTFDLSAVTGTVSVVGTILDATLFQSIADDLGTRLVANGGDVKDTVATFTIAASRANIASGEKLNVLLGKVMRYFSDLKSVAFSGSKADVGLSKVANTGDSATPASGGTNKFTTGGAYTELAKKVDKVTGKGLSTNDYTTADMNKLAGIAAKAEVNVNADWNATSGDAVILNKPTIPTVPVQSVNSKTGSVVLTGSDIATSSADSETLDNKTIANMLHLGAYDTYTYDSTTGIYTVTRKTGYTEIKETSDLVYQSDSHQGEYIYRYNCSLRLNDCTLSAPTSNNADANELSIAMHGTFKYLIVWSKTLSTIEALKAYLAENNIYVQYPLSVSYTETYDDRHFARTGQPYIEEWKKSEADRSSNLCNTFDRSNIPSTSSLYSATLNSDGSYTSTATSDGRTWSYSSSDFKFILEPGTYTLSSIIKSSDADAGVAIFDSNNNGLPSVFTLTSRTSVGIMVKSYTGSAYIMLNRGSVALPYQPYEGEVVHGKGLAETLSAYPTSQSVSETYLSKTVASSTYVAKSSFALLEGTVAEVKAKLVTYASTYGYAYIPAMVISVSYQDGTVWIGGSINAYSNSDIRVYSDFDAMDVSNTASCKALIYLR